MGYKILKDELLLDPLSIGYSAMTDKQAADSLSAKTRSVDRTTMTSGEIMEAVDGAEFSMAHNSNPIRDTEQLIKIFGD